MKERVLKIGKPDSLASIATIPDKIDTNAPVVIILNSGVMHHVGACRLSVKVARKLATSGITSLRFDFSGIGDSATRSGALSFEESASNEIVEVMDHLESSRGFSKFILFGLCSGADAAYEAALKDKRIVGMCQIDPYSYRTFKSYAYHWLPRIFSFSHWKLFLKYRLGMMQPSPLRNVDESSVELPSYVREFPPREQVRDGFKALVERQVNIYTIFTSGQAYYYKDQFEDSMSDMEFNGLLQTQFYPKCKHIITEPHYQTQAVDDITTWVEKTSSLYIPKNEKAA